MHKTKTHEISVSRTMRKIGRTTYIVSSTYAENNQQDIISIVARLIQNESNLSADADNAKSA